MRLLTACTLAVCVQSSSTWSRLTTVANRRNLPPPGAVDSSPGPQASRRPPFSERRTQARTLRAGGHSQAVASLERWPWRRAGPEELVGMAVECAFPRGGSPDARCSWCRRRCCRDNRANEHNHSPQRSDSRQHRPASQVSCLRYGSAELKHRSVPMFFLLGAAPPSPHPSLPGSHTTSFKRVKG